MKNLGKFAFPYFGDFFLLLKFGSVVAISWWWLVPLFILDQIMGSIIIKQTESYFRLAFPFFSVIFLVLNLTATISVPYWWLIWFFATDLTSVGIGYITKKNKKDALKTA